MVCLLNSYLYVMFRSCFESLASVVPIKLVCAARCGTPRIVAHRTYMGSCGGKNDWQFSNPRIDTARHTCHFWWRIGLGQAIDRLILGLADCFSELMNYT